MAQSTKTVRRLRPGVDKPSPRDWLAEVLASEGVKGSLLIAGLFALLAGAVLTLRSQIVPWRPGQVTHHDIVARVDFDFYDHELLLAAQSRAEAAEPHVFRSVRDHWDDLERALTNLPERVANKTSEELDADLKDLRLDNAQLALLQSNTVVDKRQAWRDSVRNYVERLRDMAIVVLSREDHQSQIGRSIRVPGIRELAGDELFSLEPVPVMGGRQGEVYTRLSPAAADNFSNVIAPKIVELTVRQLWSGPTHEFDEGATRQARKAAADRVPTEVQRTRFLANQRIVAAGEISEANWQRLRAEHVAYRDRFGLWSQNLGLFGAVSLATVVLSAYIAKFKPRIISNHGRGVGLAVLLLSTLLIAQLLGIGTGRLHFMGVAPTILATMIVLIAYDQRFALGVGTLHAVLVTLGLGQDLGFFLTLQCGVVAVALSSADIRSRSRPVEIGGVAAAALMAGTVVSGLLAGVPLVVLTTDAFWAGLAGMAVGFFVLGAVPFIERAFRITTSMTLLELADTGHPLLRLLATSAPGTYQHSQAVATLAEEAASAVNANALLTRVASLYHDVGKINKAEYFIENQTPGTNRHMTLTPSVSMLIIAGHVKDGLQLAKDYRLPTSLTPFIQSHHGTTLVEFFYHRAQKAEERKGDTDAAVDEHQFRYGGPKPKTREVAILMLADAAESACRTIEEPTAQRIESVVHDIVIKRLLDGQFDECEITMKEIELVERSLIRTLIGIYHPRIAYPGNETSIAVAEVAEAKTG